MTDANRDLHVYLRSIAQGERTSLSVLAGLVTPGSRVLDLGTGSGALGEHLRENAGCIVDGVTINEQEAAIARPHYRRIEIADLEQPDWISAFSGERYDFIVCADVLEHLRRPETALKACRELLAPGGKVLISVPNAGYSGLVAELMQGNFSYRDEGLLDRTHLRFFTRRSLIGFLDSQGWGVEAVEAIERPLNESEFKAPFDQLPPAVARYLLALPDAVTYQLVAAVHPGAVSHAETEARAAEPGAALFSAQLFLGSAAGFREDRKVVAAGVVGKSRQLLHFALPRDGMPLTALRLDPADRPGFLHLHRISVRAAGLVEWEWRCDRDGIGALEATEHHDMLLRSPWPASAALILLHGDDPTLVLPVPQQALQACAAAEQASVEVELGWPMSADYMALAEVVHPMAQEMESIQRGTQRMQAQARDEATRSVADAQQARAAAGQAQLQADRARQEADEARADAEQARADVLRGQGEALEARLRLGEIDRSQQETLGKLRLLKQQNARLADEKELLARQKLALQANQAHLGQMYEALAKHLRWIESSTVFRATRPLVHAKMALERLVGRRAAEPAAMEVVVRPVAPRADVVDVIVPVYRGLEDTRLCVESVRASRCSTPWRLVIVNDASPEPEVTDWLRDISQKDSRILLLENEENLGFVGTVNRGMAVSDRNDVLLLNSDTEVANDWLDRLRRAAYCDTRVASVTPFSNNATICSYPRFCEANALPPGCDTAGLDALFAATNAGQVLDVPTGVGFCMYIRRDCLDAVGHFDVKNFGKGYGEENDFCRRAAQAGWRNLHALDTFVLHTGGVSFGESKSAREREAVEKLRKLHPSYDGIVHAFVAMDAAKPARMAVDIARIRARKLPCILAVLHNRGGGTPRQAAELADYLRGRATFLTLTPAPGNAVWLELLEPGAALRLEFSLPGQWDDVLDVLRGLGITHVHYHHFLGHGTEVLRLGEQLGVRWDFTAHDFYSMCPQISLTDDSDRYCGEDGTGRCRRCEPHTPAPEGMDIAAWRERNGELLAQARHVLTPSLDTARRFVRMWPSVDVRVAPHTDLLAAPTLPSVGVTALPPSAPLKVVVIGALSRIKGADLLEEVARLAASKGAPVEFHLIGYAYRDLRKQPHAALTVHGAYRDEDLPRLLGWIKPNVVWFPALWPETYSYTLSACFLAGLPVVAPNLGAFPERLLQRPWSWVEPWDREAAGWLDFFVSIRDRHFATGTSPFRPIFAANQADQVAGPWSYDTDYLQGMEWKEPAALPREVVARYRASLAAAFCGQGPSLKQAALSGLVRLRSSRGLRYVARAIPFHWQRRAKNWLLK